jgi:hypothetical protein
MTGSHDARSSGKPPQTRWLHPQDGGHPFPPVQLVLQPQPVFTHFTTQFKQVITQMLIFAD